MSRAVFLALGFAALVTPTSSRADAGDDRPASMAPKLNDSGRMTFGTDGDYWFVYNASSTRFELWTSDSNGGGTDALVLTIDDGTKAMSVNTVVASGVLASDLSFSTTASHALTGNGIIPGHLTTDMPGASTGPYPTRIAATSLWSGGSTGISTGFSSGLLLQGGIGVRRIAMTAASCGGAVITIRNPSSVTCTENGANDSTHFDCTGETNAVCATNAATCLNGLTGITASANSPTSGTVYIQLAESEKESTLSIYQVAVDVNVTACGAVTSDVDGNVTAVALIASPQNRETRVTADNYPALVVGAGTETIEDGSTISTWRHAKVLRPTLNKVTTGTITDAATLYIDNAPGGTATFTNGPWALWIDAGNLRLDGDLVMNDAADRKLTFAVDNDAVTPSLTLEPGTGLYASADNTIGVAVGGSNVGSISAGTATLTQAIVAFPGEAKDVVNGSCTKGEIMIDTATTVEICVCTATNTIRCVATTTTNPAD